MILIDGWMADLTAKLKDAFGAKLLFVGLQGSYRRGEANESSDIDAVVILDVISMDDLKAYREMIESMPESNKACGFISGKQELMNWPKHELFQFKNDTLTLYGSLDMLLPEISREDIVDSIKIGASGLYHSCCHTYIHAEKVSLSDALRGFYKGASFILQGLHYLRGGEYIGSKKELMLRLEGAEREILEAGMGWAGCADLVAANPDIYFEKMIGWCSGILADTQLV